MLDFISLQKYTDSYGRCSQYIQVFLLSRKEMGVIHLLKSEGGTIYIIQEKLALCSSFHPDVEPIYYTEDREPRNMNYYNTPPWDITEEPQSPTINLETHK